jgi:NADH-quinone oxidoreductase subunit K
MTPEPFFALATVLFSLGLIGIVSRRNLFVVYMSIELMLSSVNLVLALFSRLHADMHGSVIALLMIAVIAAEAALFLAIIIQLYRQRRTIDSDAFSRLSQRDVS